MNMKTYQTNNLILRPYEMNDYHAWKEANLKRLPPQNAFDVGKVENLDLEYFCDFVAYLKKCAIDDKLYVFSAFDKITGEHVGIVEITILLRNGFNWGLYGVSVHNHLWGKGYGSEMTKIADQIAKDLNLRRLEADVENGNERSEKMLKTFGYQFEGVRKNFYFNGEKFIDMNVFYKILL